MAPHSSTLAWKIPWTEELGGLQSTRSRRVGHDWATSLSLFTFMHWRRKWQPTPVFLPGESQGRGAWWAAVYGVTQSSTRLKQLSSSSVKGACRSGTAWAFKLSATVLFVCRVDVLSDDCWKGPGIWCLYFFLDLHLSAFLFLFGRVLFAS